MINRMFDLTLALFAGMMLISIAAFVAVLVKLTSTGPVLYWSDRVGLNNDLFLMPKFRTMKVDTPEVASDLLVNPQAHLTAIGSFLRRTSLDEIPQLWCVLVGNMSVVGPRPALFNQYELIELRSIAGVHKVRPGITGWAQVNGRDKLSIHKKVAFDTEYLQKQNLWFDLKIIWMTIGRVVRKQAVSH